MYAKRNGGGRKNDKQSNGRGSSFGREKGSREKNSRGKKECPEFIGKVQMTREGYIFVIVEGQEDDIYVKAGKTKGALHGDTVRVAVTKAAGYGKGREGEVKEIVERSSRPFVGILHVVGNQAWVLMQSRTMPYDIQVDLFSPDNEKWNLRENKGSKVAAVIDGWPRSSSVPIGHIVDVLGKPGENDTEMHAILAEYGLPYRFEPEVENAADGISEEITAKDIKGRKDFRDTLTFTIDPEDAKDFDDALSFKKLENGNYEVGVHIADVSYYVTPGTPVDKEAQARGTSVYLVDRTVPMLPEKLSNKLCSLRPCEDKLTFSAVFEITPKAKVVSSWFGRTVINSDYRFAYETAQQIIDNGEASLEMDLRGGTDGKQAPVLDPVLIASPEAAAKFADRSASAMGTGVLEGCVIPKDCKEAVLILWNLAEQFRKKRFASGAISFERPEMKVEVDLSGKPVRIYQKISKEANWLIEEFMLLANRAVAEFIATEGKMDGKAHAKAKTFVYRVHGEPNQEKISGLRNFAGMFGYSMGETGSGKEISKSLNELLEQAKDKPEFAALEMIALRAMAKAIYTTDNIGHYGLAFKFYTHFTSPIRRYPDTMVHRLLALYLDGADNQNRQYYEDQCKHASEREVVAAEAERASIKYKLVEYMQDKIGGEFDGHISGLTEWGMYVEIEPTKVEGMVALRDIQSDYFEFDQDHYRIVGRRTRKQFRLGDPVRIRVKGANLDQKIIDYELIDLPAQKPQIDEPVRRGKADPYYNDDFYSSQEDEEFEKNLMEEIDAVAVGANKEARKKKVKAAIKASKTAKKKATSKKK